MLGSSCEEEGIKLQKFRPRRENSWDSIIAGRVCERVVRIEEKGLINAVLMEWKRARNIGMWLSPKVIR